MSGKERRVWGLERGGEREATTRSFRPRLATYCHHALPAFNAVSWPAARWDWSAKARRQHKQPSGQRQI